MPRIQRYLGLAVLVVMAAIVAVGLFAIRRDTENLRIISQDNILWSAAQMEVELLRFQLSVATLGIEQSEAALESVRERFDILWSRVAMMSTGRVGQVIRRYDEEFGSLPKISAYLENLDPVISGLTPDDTATVNDILDEIEGFQRDLRLYTLRVVRADTAATAAVRESIRNNSQTTALISLAAVLISMLSLALILRENHRQREMAEVSRRSAEQAEQASRAKSRFLSMMSHELRNPLNGVLGPLALLGQGDLGRQERELVRRAQGCGEAMLELIGGLLDYGEIQDGRFVLNSEPFRLRALADKVAGSLSVDGAREPAISVAPGAPAQVRGDIDRCRQTFVHLCEFALEAAEQGSVSLGFSHDGTNLIGEIEFEGEGQAIGWKLGLLSGLAHGPEDQVSSEALRPLIARGLISAAGGELTVIDRPGSQRRIRVSIPAEPERVRTIRVYLETKSAAMATIYQAALRSDRVVFATPGAPDAPDVVLVDSTSVGEEALLCRLHRRFPGAHFVSLGRPKSPKGFDDILEAPNDISSLRDSILSRLAS